MISQVSALQCTSQYAPCLAAAFSGLLPGQTGAAARTTGSSRQAPPVFGSWGSTRSITSKEFDPDDKLGRPTTPWVRQVISGVDLMRHPKYNKGASGGQCRTAQVQPAYAACSQHNIAC